MRITKQTGWLLILILALLLVVPATTAQAQDGGDKWVWGGNYTLREGERLDGNLSVAGGSARLEDGSSVHGDVTVWGGSLNVDGTITGDVSVWGGSIRLGDSAVVQGDITRMGGSLERSRGARVEGRVVEGFGNPRLIPMPMAPGRIDFGVRDGGEGPLAFLGRFIAWQLATVGWALLLALLALVAVALLPRHVERVANTAQREPGMAFILGLVTMLVALLAGLILLIACGLGLLVWLMGLLAVLLGWIAVGLWLGQRMLRLLKMRESSSLLEVALGVFVITVIARIPCLGFLFWLVFASIGVGAVVLTRFGTAPYTGSGFSSSTGRAGLYPAPYNGPQPPAPPASVIEPPAPDAPSVREDFVPDPPGTHDESK